MLINLFFSSLPLLFSSFKGLLFSLQYINKLSKGFPVGDIMDHNISCAYLLICSKSFVYNMSCIVRIITNQNVVKNRTGFDLYIMVVVSSDRIYVIWYNQGLWWGTRVWPTMMFGTCQTSIPTYCKGFKTYRSGSSSNSAKGSSIKVLLSMQDAVKLLSGEIHKTFIWQTVDMIYMTICKGHYYSTRQKIRYICRSPGLSIHGVFHFPL